jgi:PTS system nitrogen regulatory IIA component
MHIGDFLSYVLVDISASDKTRLLNDLASQAAAAVNLPVDRISSELLKREQLGSTGTGGGVAIPHARLPELKKPFGMLVRLSKAIPFDAVDEQPVDIVFLLLLPTAPAGEQLNALASVARRLRDTDCLRRVRAAADTREIYDVVVRAPNSLRANG